MFGVLECFDDNWCEAGEWWSYFQWNTNDDKSDVHSAPMLVGRNKLVWIGPINLQAEHA